MKKLLFFLLTTTAFAQSPELGFKTSQEVPATPVKNQGITGTCWCFATTAMLESECIRKNIGEFDLSEMFIVRNIYLEKAKNYVRRQGKANFDEGGLGHDVISGITRYGAMPESVYAGKKGTSHDHSKLVGDLRAYLNKTIKTSPVPLDWETGFIALLDDALGSPPATFEHQNKSYTPQQFATEVIGFKANDYVSLTSFSHHPTYQSFVLEVPDNWGNGSFYNVTIEDLFEAVNASLSAGYSVMWDADVSNKGFQQNKGIAVETTEIRTDADAQELVVTPELRQERFDAQITTDDHLMQLTGTATASNGKKFFLVKNSWGEKAGPFRGYIHVSEAYFAMNTVSIVVPKATLPDSLKAKLN